MEVEVSVHAQGDAAGGRTFPAGAKMGRTTEAVWRSAPPEAVDAARLLVAAVDRVDAPPRRSFAGGTLDLRDGAGLALEPDRDRAVGLVGRPPADAALRRAIAQPGAVVDALDAAPHDEPAGDGHRPSACSNAS